MCGPGTGLLLYLEDLLFLITQGKVITLLCICVEESEAQGN